MTFSDSLPPQLSAGALFNNFCTVGGSEAGIRVSLGDTVYLSTNRRVLLCAHGGTSLKVPVVRLRRHEQRTGNRYAHKGNSKETDAIACIANGDFSSL